MLTSDKYQSPEFTTVKRHDDHNVELKTVVELSGVAQKVATEMFFFFPKNFELAMIGKQELLKDFRIRLRLAIPSMEGFDDEDFLRALRDLADANARLDAEVMEFQSLQEEVPSNSREAVLEAAKDLASIVAERLKKMSAEHGRQYFVSQTLVVTSASRASGCEAFIKNLQSVHQKMSAIREAMYSSSQDGQSLNSLLDEFISQLYVQYLGSVSTDFHRFKTELTSQNHSDTEQAGEINESFARAGQVLKSLQETEGTYRRAKGLGFESQSEIERERHLNRLSQLKKFFQSKTFIDVTRTEGVRKVTESTALIGTAIAGVTAALLEQWGRKNVATLASQGLMVISLGVFLYVIRDRMKDWANRKLKEKAMGLIPDFESQLIANGKDLGSSLEWFHIMNSKFCETPVLKARHADSPLERNLRLPEDVIQVKRVFYLGESKQFRSNQPGLPSSGQARALFENVRINLDRHLKFMDDPFKELTDLEADGRLTRSRSHRVYHFHIVTQTSIYDGDEAVRSKFRHWYQNIRILIGFPPPAASPRVQTLTAHRVVLDKSGIIRVEPFSLNDTQQNSNR